VKSFLNIILKLLAVFVLAAVAVGITLIAVGLFSWGHHQVVQANKAAKENAAIEVLRMYASPPNPTLAWRFYLLKNTSGKTITAIKFSVTVFNSLKEQIDRSVVTVAKPIAPNAVVYCDVYTLFDANTGLPLQSGSYLDLTDRRLVHFAEHEVGCKPGALRVVDPYKCKVLAVAYAH
jgi:hypothetical protein